MWSVIEHREVQKVCRKLPPAVLKKYQLWKRLVETDGPQALRTYPGFRDEHLEGRHFGERSSRLSLRYRVIYSVSKDVVSVYVLEITPHEY